MKAVNLMPADARRSGGQGTTGPNASMFLLGGLAAVVGMVGANAMIGNKVDDRKADLAQVQAQAETAEKQATALAPYKRFTTISQQRQQTVKQLVDTRFDWPHALREIARVMPAGADLLSLNASAAPGGGAGGAAASTGGGSGLRAALPVPAFEITGCTGSQDRVAVLMARLRAVDGVQRVSLESSEKKDQNSAGSASAPAAAGSAADSSDCRRTSDAAQFKLTVFFEETGAPLPQAPGGAPATAAAPAATSNGGSQ